MNRKEFLKTISIVAPTISSFSLTSVFANNLLNYNRERITDIKDLAKISDELNKKFLMLIEWLRRNKWAQFFKNELSVDLDQSGEALIKELIRILDTDTAQRLANLKNKKNGFDDFAGTQLINPGYPALSLLFHALSSPRVKPENFQPNQYPTVEQLDTLENYIYALKKWEVYKKDFAITNDQDLVLAVFSYEYRPAFKTPHQAYADMVYSRTGIARIGDEAINYDAINRSYTNKPRTSDDPTGRRIAVTPARYGLFLAKVVTKDALSLRTTERYKGKHSRFNKEEDIYDDKNDNNNIFLQPLRKVFNDDLLFGSEAIKFKEHHLNQKLQTLPLNITADKRISSDLIETDPKATSLGSSFLVISIKRPLIRLLKGVYFPVDKDARNRYFTSYSAKENSGFFIETYNGRYRVPNDYLSGRNNPMYVHLAHRILSNGDIEQIKKTELKVSNATELTFEEVINTGGYNAPVYEDSICDGVVSVDLSALKSAQLLSILKKDVYPAFSIVTAPDFFPYVDLFDLVDFDVEPGKSNETNFYEGGVASLASIRMRPNPNLLNPLNNTQKAFPFSNNSDKLANTFTAVISTKAKNSKQWKYDYLYNSYLPDTCSSVFAPGWDITYGNKIKGEEATVEPFLSTQGLGAPFVEDMKLCAAMNGMWAAASPDTARVFQGTVTDSEYYNDGWRRNPTAIPLMDEELGFHMNSPASPQAKNESRLGWDGEQGPFLEKVDNKWVVNFTDLGRADYVENALQKDIGFDMSKLRELNTKELISRMKALEKCISKIKYGSSVALTNLWLVSAEKLKANEFEGNGIPINIFGLNKEWATKLQLPVNATENYYLFLFATTEQDKDQSKRQWAETGTNVKRRRQFCESLYACHVTDSSIKKCQVINNFNVLTNPSWA